MSDTKNNNLPVEAQTETAPEQTLTRLKKKLVADAIKKTGCCKMSKLLDAISEDLCNRYPEKRIDYELSRLHLETTKDIRDLIELYFDTFPGEYFRN